MAGKNVSWMTYFVSSLTLAKSISKLELYQNGITCHHTNNACDCLTRKTWNSSQSTPMATPKTRTIRKMCNFQEVARFVSETAQDSDISRCKRGYHYLRMGVLRVTWPLYLLATKWVCHSWQLCSCLNSITSICCGCWGTCCATCCDLVAMLWISRRF